MEKIKTKKKTAKSSKKKNDKKQEDKVSYHRRPEDLELDTWQFLLRKKFGEENPFEIINTGAHKVFSEFKVLNPDAQSGYVVSIRNVESLSSATKPDAGEPKIGEQAEEVDDLDLEIPTEGVNIPDIIESETFEDNDIIPQPASETHKQPTPKQDNLLPESAHNPVASPVKEEPAEPQRSVPAAAATVHSGGSPQELIQTGISFFSNLAQTLKSPEKTQELVSSIVKKDESTGKTYLQIPIDNQEVVSNALNVLGSLFGGLMK